MDMDMAEMKHASSFVSDNDDDPEADVWWRSSDAEATRGRA